MTIKQDGVMFEQAVQRGNGVTFEQAVQQGNDDQAEWCDVRTVSGDVHQSNTRVCAGLCDEITGVLVFLIFI